MHNTQNDPIFISIKISKSKISKISSNNQIESKSRLHYT